MIELIKEYIKDGKTVTCRLLVNESQVEELLKDKRISRSNSKAAPKVEKSSRPMKGDD